MKTIQKSWLLTSFLLVMIVTIPLWVIFINFFEPTNDTWEHISKYLLSDYIKNSFLLILGVSVLVLFFGIVPAWLLSRYNFFGSAFFRWGLILPLSLPTYIASFTYAGFFSYTGGFQQFLTTLLGRKNAALLYFDFLTFPNLCLVLSLVLFPYVYIASYNAFSRTSSIYLQNAQLLGKNGWSTFFKVALPLARPAIVGALLLVIMELLNDYGAMKYFGINTFTTGIFRTWFSYEDLSTAIKLSAILLLLVFTFMLLERLQRGKNRYENYKNNTPVTPQKVSSNKSMLYFTICFLPFLFGFLIPVIQLLVWALDSKIPDNFLSTSINTLVFAFSSALCIVTISIFLSYGERVNKNHFNKTLTQISTLGYAIPGAIIAIGIMVPFIAFDKWLIHQEITQQFIFSGTYFLLIFAFCTRYLSVGFQPIHTGFTKQTNKTDEAARSLGSSPLKSLLRVNLPSLKSVLISALLLVFIDVMKELPLTLILRPFNVDTLATNAFELASDELLSEAAFPSLIIVLFSSIAAYQLRKLVR